MLRAASLFAITTAALVSACSSQAPDVVAPQPTAGEGQLKTTPVYPAGPYGSSVGSIVEDFQFLGFPTGDARVADPNALSMVRLSDFYNPHADDASYAPPDADHDDRLFPPGSPYGAGKKKPKALLIDIASVWCGPCNEEAKTTLPPLHAKYSKCGGEFLLQLQDGPTVGTAAVPKNLSAWGTKYSVDFPHVIDPSGKLGPLFKQSVFPTNMMIDTRTMTLARVTAGVPQTSDWKIFDKLIGDDACLAAAASGG
jgi:hypothetical protein